MSDEQVCVSLAEAFEITVLAGGGGGQGPPGVGVPAGGTTGQHLAKTSNVDYATGWVTDTGGGGDVPATRTISTNAPLSGGGDLSANRTLSIAAASTTVTGAARFATTTETTVGTLATVSVTPAGLSATFGTVATPRLLDGDTGQFSNVTIVDDGTDTGTWPERFRWNYRRASDGRTRRVFFLNEYGEARCVPAKDNTVPLRVFAQEFAADGVRDPSVPLIEIMDNRDDRNLTMTINNLGAAWFQGSLAVDGELFFDGPALAGALESIVLEAGDPAPAVGVWLRKT